MNNNATVGHQRSHTKPYSASLLLQVTNADLVFLPGCVCEYLLDSQTQQHKERLEGCSWVNGNDVVAMEQFAQR